MLIWISLHFKQNLISYNLHTLFNIASFSQCQQTLVSLSFKSSGTIGSLRNLLKSLGVLVKSKTMLRAFF
jgi:hypothetical protein